MKIDLGYIVIHIFLQWKFRKWSPRCLPKLRYVQEPSKMRGTFYLRSRTFYHHMSEMRKNIDCIREPPQNEVQPVQPAECHDDLESNTNGPESPLRLSSFVNHNSQDQQVSGIDPNNCVESKDIEDIQFGISQQTNLKTGSPIEEDLRSKRLLPSLPNDMTIDLILTKLPWSTLFFTLPAVNSAWLQAIRSHQVHKARIRTNTSQTLIAIIHQTLVKKKSTPCLDFYSAKHSEEFEHALAISLYDPNRDRWHLLPAIEGVDRGIPYACECVCLEGKVYVFGGYGNFCPTNAVYVLDLAAGLGLWQRCANMRSSRVGFSGGAMDGKIFIFGGTRSGPFELSSECLEAEVFDPRKNTWTSIAPTLHRHTSHCVACVEGEFIVHGGRCWTDMDSDDDGDHWLHDNSRIAGRMAEAYNPGKDEWREVKNFAVGIVGAPVVVDGKLHIISERNSCVYAYNKQSNSWKASQGISWEGLGGGFQRNSSSGGGSSNVVIEATAWSGEILAAMCWWNVARFRSGLENWEDQIVLLKSRGLGCTDKDLEWDRIASADEFHEQILCMRPIQL